ncbi:MAG: site-specific DNA-methyltransferase [Halobacteriales archaeon]|nr:site-specific DNA-methyltransferase [Halobacteriales archaeon]
MEGVTFASSEDLRAVRAGSVQAVVCSPPYWDRKDYGHAAQLGHGEDYARYLDRLDAVWQGCLRALRPSGTMWVVIDKVWERGSVLPIPWDIAQRCQALGFTLLDLLVWHKPSAIAGMTPRNLVNKHETIVVLAKGPKPKLRAEAGDVWRVPVKAGSLRATPDHEAPYPEELIARILACSTDEGDLVLDPFLGSGTTMVVARRLGRRCLGYEVNPAFAPLIAARLGTPLPKPRRKRS